MDLDLQIVDYGLPRGNFANIVATNQDLIHQNISFLKRYSEEIERKQEGFNQTTKKVPTEITAINLKDWNFEKNRQEDIEEYFFSSPFVYQDSYTHSKFSLDSFNQKELPFTNGCHKVKPQLAIIIDDIAFMTQYQAAINLPFKITPSFFPPYEDAPNTPQIAKMAPFYMVHLPLEALNFRQKGHLNASDSKEVIQQRIQAIKKDFPNLAFLNNHTGSKFTQDEVAMSFLLEVLNQEGVTFVDSRTTAKSVTREYYQKQKVPSLNTCQETPFLERDVFLDNERDVVEITNNIIKAVEIAKFKGYAIAIGHPHEETLNTLRNMSGFLEESGVNLVYVKELIIP
ncbi:MAG: divergent polysaccharide deacetylase family protein [Helicobacter sp.]|nr:divergent polysaccharide deacetylase family protein [Helicobacter sp.]